MNCRILFLFLIIILNSCAPVKQENDSAAPIYTDPFVSKGFTLVYSEILKKNKTVSSSLDNRSLLIFQKNLKKNTSVKITNLLNKKYLIAKVSKKSNYPNFYNSVISSRIKNELEIDEKEPYVEIKEINYNSAFVAKKAKTFDEEKNVATKAPVDEIEIKTLSGTNVKKKKITDSKFSYIIKIGDFYFEKSAVEMIQKIKKETTINKVNLTKLSATKFRVFIGPFDNLNSLKAQFNAINILQFENIEIIKK
tara:strand:+ start:6 stop:758 length:753 start_codon:yes stop_codon:yes gene_type:complete